MTHYVVKKHTKKSVNSSVNLTLAGKSSQGSVGVNLRWKRSRDMIDTDGGKRTGLRTVTSPLGCLWTVTGIIEEEEARGHREIFIHFVGLEEMAAASAVLGRSKNN